MIVHRTVDNGILFGKLFRPNVRKEIVFVIKEIVCKLEAKDREFAKDLRSLDQLIQTLKDQNSF